LGSSPYRSLGSRPLHTFLDSSHHVFELDIEEIVFGILLVGGTIINLEIVSTVIVAIIRVDRVRWA
jgi:hypothetical protein